MDCSLCPQKSPGKNTGVGCHSLLWEIFTTEGLNLGPPAVQADSFPLEPPRQTLIEGNGALAQSGKVGAGGRNAGCFGTVCIGN